MKKTSKCPKRSIRLDGQCVKLRPDSHILKGRTDFCRGYSFGYDEVETRFKDGEKMKDILIELEDEITAIHAGEERWGRGLNTALDEVRSTLYQ
jgi:hypothetical protein